jgi:hypothetical protein
MTGRRFNTLGQYHDSWARVLLCAPDSFWSFDDRPVNQREELEQAFDGLREGFPFVEKRLKDQRLVRICRELIEMSYEAYVAGDSRLGAHSLQECEGMIWPGSKLPVKHAVEAERRAFGEVRLFAGVVVSPFPRDGTQEDLGAIQRQLLQHAIESCKPLLNGEVFLVSWVAHKDGSIRELKARSQKKAREAIRAGAMSGEVVGAASAQMLPGGGLLVYHLEEAGRPFIAVMNLLKDGVFESPRYHVHAPVNFE